MGAIFYPADWLIPSFFSSSACSFIAVPERPAGTLAGWGAGAAPKPVTGACTLTEGVLAGAAAGTGGLPIGCEPTESIPMGSDPAWTGVGFTCVAAAFCC